MSAKNNILSRKEVQGNIKKTYDDIGKELYYISNKNYKIKKDIRKNRNDIGITKKYVRYNQYRLKTTNKPDIFKKVLNQTIKKVYTIKSNLHIAKNELKNIKRIYMQIKISLYSLIMIYAIQIQDYVLLERNLKRLLRQQWQLLMNIRVKKRNVVINNNNNNNNNKYLCELLIKQT